MEVKSNAVKNNIALEPGILFFTASYKKDLHDPDHHDGVITDLEPDLLEFHRLH